MPLISDTAELLPINAALTANLIAQIRAAGGLAASTTLTADLALLPGNTDPQWPDVLPKAGEQVLYREAAGLEKAFANTEADRLIKTYAELPRDQWDPYKISYRNLAYLAWAMGVNLWEDDWPEAFRRYWVANQWTKKYERGSLVGLEDFVSTLGVGSTDISAEVLRVTRPPARTYPLAQVANLVADLEALVPGAKYIGSLTASPNSRYAYENLITWTDTRPKPAWQDFVNYERSQYVARFPQLRGYPYVGRVQLPWLCFLNGSHHQTLDLELPAPVAGAFDYEAAALTPPPANDQPLGSNANEYIYWNWHSTNAAKTWTDLATPRPYTKNGSFLGPLRPLYPTNYDAGGNYTYTYTLWDRGVETTLTHRTVVNVQEGFTANSGYFPGAKEYDDLVILPPKTDIFYFCSEPKKYLGGGDVVKKEGTLGIFLGTQTDFRTIRIPRAQPPALNWPKAQYQTVLPSAQPLNILPQKVTQQHPIRKTELYAARGFYLTPHNSFLPRSNAWQFLYDLWYLFDPNRVPDTRKASLFMGHTRFGIANYTAEALIKVRVKQLWFQTQTSGYLKGFLKARNDEPINKLRRAVCASMALRDTVLINTNVTRRLRVSDIIRPDGTFTVGQWVQN